MMAWPLTLLVAALLFAIFGWLRGRPRGWIFPSDAFFLASVVVTGVVPFLNLRATAPDIAMFTFSDDVIQRALLGSAIMYGVFGCVWLFRPTIALKQIVLPPGYRVKMWQDVSGFFAFSAVCFFIISFLVLLYPPYFDFKVDVLQFVLGRIDPNQYQEARRVLYVDNTFIGSFIGRIRYTIYPILYLSCVMFLIRNVKVLWSFLIGVVLTVIGPASLSKAVLLLYFGYFWIAYAMERDIRWPLRAKNVVVMGLIVAPIAMSFLSAIYFLQYPGMFRAVSDIPKAFQLSFYRMFVATYQGLLQYFSTYPNPYGFAGISSTSVLSSLFGVRERNLDLEVSTYFLGPERGMLTSFPTIFIGNAYASFGYFGVLIYSLFVGIFLYFCDFWIVMIRNHYLRIMYFSIMTVNVLHFAVLAAPAALLTYGCGVIPIVLLLADRALSAPSRRRGRFGYPHPLAPMEKS